MDPSEYKYPDFYVCDEMKSLREKLDEMKISWKDCSDKLKDGGWICRTHFYYKGRRWSVIHGYSSYGGYNFHVQDEKLLELYDNKNSPIGWLTADKVISILEEPDVMSDFV